MKENDKEFTDDEIRQQARGFFDKHFSFPEPIPCDICTKPNCRNNKECHNCGHPMNHNEAD